MEALLLCYRDEPLRDFPLDARPLEVGSGAGCDVVVHDALVAERHCLVERRGGDVVVIDLRPARPAGELPWRLVPGVPLPVGARHALVRIPDAPTRPLALPFGQTEPVPIAPPAPDLTLVVGRGLDARRVPLDLRPLRIGASPSNDVVVSDRAVSGRHCRIDPLESGLFVRDLGSRNGTWVDGVRVESARLAPGMRLRVGRTDLALVARGRSGDAREDGLVAASPQMIALLGEVERAARLRWPVLVRGESGAGKEGIARALHHRGPRRDQPFVALNAGALPHELVESELFGHERGAFTGAVAQQKGFIEQADGGTLFLDEIGELGLDLQSRLLRVVETWEVRRVGSPTPRKVDVRLVCATHRDLRQMVALGTFREDLYYRLVPTVLDVPPLRERPEDLVALAGHFLEQIAPEVGRRTLGEDALVRLAAHRWPGNARELRHVLCAAAANAGASVLDAGDVTRAIERISGPCALPGSPDTLAAAVHAAGGNLTRAAKALGMPRSTLRDRLREAKDG